MRERLELTPDEIDSGHLPALGRPLELAERLEAYVAGPDETEQPSGTSDG